MNNGYVQSRDHSAWQPYIKYCEAFGDWVHTSLLYHTTLPHDVGSIEFYLSNLRETCGVIWAFTARLNTNIYHSFLDCKKQQIPVLCSVPELTFCQSYYCSWSTQHSGIIMNHNHFTIKSSILKIIQFPKTHFFLQIFISSECEEFLNHVLGESFLNITISSCHNNASTSIIKKYCS